jgi:C4-type Zn-finger protein
VIEGIFDPDFNYKLILAEDWTKLQCPFCESMNLKSITSHHIKDRNRVYVEYYFCQGCYRNVQLDEVIKA